MSAINNHSPLVSVIAISFNQEKWVLETLDSIKRQTLQDFEIIYADDASTDRSAELAVEWLASQEIRSRTILHKHNLGVCRTLNEAIELSSGKYLQLISCDDLLLPGKLEHDVALMNEASPRVAVVYSDAELIDGRGEPASPHLFSAYTGRAVPSLFPVFESLVRGNFISALSVLLRKSAVQEVGGYDESLSYEDYDMWMRLSRGHEFMFSDEVLVKYRLHGANMHLKGNLNDYWILRKHVECMAVRERLQEIVAVRFVNGDLGAAERNDYLEWSRQYPVARTQVWRWLLWIAPGCFTSRVIRVIAILVRGSIPTRAWNAAAAYLTNRHLHGAPAESGK